MGFPLGTDFKGVDDLDADMSVSFGRTCLAEASARRIITPKNGLFYAPSYGDDVRRFVNTTASGMLVAATAEQEIEQDERVQRADSTATVNGAEIRAEIKIQDGQGPFTFTINVNELTAQLLLEGE